MLTKSQRKILEKDGWDIVCESPFEMEKCKGFQAPITIDNEEEAIHQAYALIVSKELHDTIVRKEKDENKDKKAKYIKEYKKIVRKLIDQGITVDTLFDFYLHSNNFGWKYNPSSKCLKECFKEVIEGV